MYHLGLDFGTTNSTLAYMHLTGRLSAFRHGGAQGKEYVPTVVAEGPRNEVLIGEAALKMLDKEGWKVHRFFKMLLACDEPALLARYGYAKDEPERQAETYISRLIEDYKKQNMVYLIHSLVITAPEIWVTEGRHRAREFLQALGRRLGRRLNIEKVMVRSAPQAAIAFFAYRFQQAMKKPFEGLVVCCHCGGWTLDFSVAQVSSEKILVMRGTGSGRAEGQLGNAGVAFDTGVVEILASNSERNQTLQQNLLLNFEEQKIIQSDHYRETLASYLVDPDADDVLFEVGPGYQVMASHFKRAFEARVGPSLKTALEKLGVSAQEAASSDRFRVLMVGGSSNLLLVQEAIRCHFGAAHSADARFDSCFAAEDVGLAIAKGAALIAAGDIQIDEKCPISLGVISCSLFDMNGGHREYGGTKGYCPVIRRGDLMSELRLPQFGGPDWFFRLAVGNIRKIPFFMESEFHCKYEFALNISGSDLCREIRPMETFQLGFSVDEDTVFHLHLRLGRGDDGERPPLPETKFSLGKLLERLRGPIHGRS